MRRVIRHIVGIVAVAAAIIGAGGRAQAADYVPGEVIVQLGPLGNINLLSSLYGLRILGKSLFAPVYRLGLPLLGNVDTVVGLLRLDPTVLAADPNLLTGLPDGTKGAPWSSAFVDRSAGASYTSPPSFGQVDYTQAGYSADGHGVTVAILDTGLSLRPAFLAPQAVPGWNYVGNTSNTDDVPGNLDTNGDGKIDEAVGHGTFIAGIIYRFAPKANLMPVKVLDSDGAGTLWNAAEGVRYAAAKGAKVINLSLGCSRDSTIFNLSLKDAQAMGAVVVAAAGNDNTSNAHSPAGRPEAITVAALNSDNTKASFSNYGQMVDVDAPGVSIVSTYWDGQFAVWSGTSFAAPMVAAQATLIRSVAPGLSTSAVKSMILSTSHSVNYWNPWYVNQLGKNGAGLIDVGAALDAAYQYAR